MTPNYQTTSRANGFTLVETLVAISVLLIAIVGPFYAIQSSITASYVARDQLTASALSQEGMEYVYALRDSNYLQNQLGNSYSWLAGINGSANATGDNADCTTANGCTLDPTLYYQGGSSPLKACQTNCSPMTLNTNTLRYTQDTNNPVTKFTRKITLTMITPFDAQVNVIVTWATLGRVYSVTTTEDLYNWQ